MKAAYRVFTVPFLLVAAALFAQAPASSEHSVQAQQLTASTTTQTQAAPPSQAAAPTQNASVAAAADAAQVPPTDPAAEDAADSKVRIVRLSQVRGKTQIDRGVGNGMETAFSNLPITQGTKLQVDEGVAEVEFEDTSTLRLTPGTVVEFPKLTRTPTGTTDNIIKVSKGTVYISLEKTKGNVYTLTCDRGTATLSPGSQARLTLDTTKPGLAVLTGGVEFRNLDGSNLRIGKKKELLLAPSGLMRSDTIGDIEDYAYDAWYENQEDYHKHYSKGSALSGSGSPYSYGLSDLNYYGAFADLPGCGNVWRPYFASAAWDPYGAGLWAWYPASGYSWVSPYPWGWAPFHYGSWMQCGGGMWGWAPGGAWTGLNNIRNPRMYPHPIHHPGQQDPPRHPFPVHPQPPHQGTAFRWVSANNKPLTFSGMNTDTHNFVFRNDSAGLGIPREMFGRLNKTAQQVNQHGPVNLPMMAVRTEPVHVNNPEVHSGTIAARNHESVTWLPAGGGHDRQAWASNNNGNNGSNGWAGSHASAGSAWSNNHPSGTNNGGGGWSGAHQSAGNNGGGGGWSGHASSGGGGGGGWSGGGHSAGSVSAGSGGGGGFSGGGGGGGHMGGGAPAGGGGGASAGGSAAHH